MRRWSNHSSLVAAGEEGSLQRVVRESCIGQSRVEMSLLVPLVAINKLAVSSLSLLVCFMIQKSGVAKGEWTGGCIKRIHGDLNVFEGCIDRTQCILKSLKKCWFIFRIIILSRKCRLKKKYSVL